ncbi:protein BIG GRAIN 1-like B [Bidens hawaiensis]|uniref:protein BIG GRAIN 1-like B n=1 Tax=Bidens hawaiensis TaxID=980011 RepID=UPI00404AD02F
MDRRESPSFSSTLLDVISRSIDERDDQKSSSKAEIIYGFPFPSRPRPIRTNISYDDDECNTFETNTSMYAKSEDVQHYEGKFVKTKSKAMKIYSYLKKGKQPVSPGGRLASFLFSLFSTRNMKKSKIPSACSGGQDEAMVHASRKSKSASSFSRTCLSKTTSSSRGKLNTDVKRSVRFYPASGSDSHVVKLDGNLVDEEVKRRVNIVKSYERKVEYVFDSIKNNVTNNDDDNDNDDASYASSDLFELDHVSFGIGTDRCMQELPLYETTSVDVNRAIANGLV